MFPKFWAYDVVAAEPHINGYECFSTTFSHHVRGACIYIKSKYKAHKVETIRSEFLEVVWCSILLGDTETVFLGVVYRSPRSFEANDASFLELLMQARSFDAKHLLITGDFNFPNFNWSNWSSPEWDMAGNKFLEILDDLLLFQHVNSPTRKQQGQVPSILDLVLSDEEYSVSQLAFSDPMGKSDHCVIEFDYLCYTVVEEPHYAKYFYKLGNYLDFVAELLEVQWTQIFELLSVDDMWSYVFP